MQIKFFVRKKKKKILTLLILSFFLSTNKVFSEEYRCFYGLNNSKSFKLIRRRNNFLWITQSLREFQLEILHENKQEIILGEKFALNDIDYYKVYYLDKTFLKLNTGNITSPKDFTSQPRSIDNLYECIIF